MDINSDDTDWSKTFNLTFKLTLDTKIQNFQFKLLHRILTTNSYLHKMKITGDNTCTFCKQVPETLTHLFFHCYKVETIWTEFREWVNGLNNNFQMNVLNISDVILLNDEFPSVVNHLIIILKYLLYTWDIISISSDQGVYTVAHRLYKWGILTIF